jgi:anti-sigma B factor antagonist
MLSPPESTAVRDERAHPGLPSYFTPWRFNAAGSTGGAGLGAPARVGRINTALTNLAEVPRTIPLMADQPLQVENVEGSQAGHRILRLTGPLTLSNLFEFQALVRAEKAPVMIIDVANVPYIDSAGIGSLMGAQVSRQKHGYSLALVSVNKRVKHALEVTRVFQFFRVYPSVAEAENALSHA